MENAAATEARPKRIHKKKSFLQEVLPRPRIASVEEASEAIGISRAHLGILIREGKVKATKVGNRWKIPVTEVERIVREMEGVV